MASHEKIKKNKEKSHFEKCKEVGRIGPNNTKIDTESALGTIKVLDQVGLDIESESSFASVRANTAVFKGKFYYEVRLITSGLM